MVHAVAFADDMATPVSTEQLASGSHYQQFTQNEKALPAAGCTLSRPKTVLLPPLGHVVTDAEREYIEITLGAKLASRAVAIAGVTVGEPDFVREQLQATVDPKANSTYSWLNT
eukprot:6311-Heterococcus_DN1.PRE.2